MVAMLFASIERLAGYPVPERFPEVRFLPREQVAALSCAGGCRPNGAYLPGHGVVLDERLDPIGDLRARAILLHELVHYLQEIHGRFADQPRCRRYVLRELEAYEVQRKYLVRCGLADQSWMTPWTSGGCVQE